jgi:hypothetical protein
VKVTFIVIDHETLSMVRNVQKLSFPCNSEGNYICSISKLIASLPRNNAVAELCSGEFKVQYGRGPEA